MKLVLHAKLKKMFGPSIEIRAKSVADALEGFSRQFDNFPREMVIEVVGFDTEDKLRAKTDVEEVHLVPSMFGGGGFGRILLGVALIVVTTVSFGAGGALIGGKLGGALLGAGIGLVLGGVMQLFMKAPTISKSNDPEASKYLGNGKNTTASGTPIPNAWGIVKLNGHWLSVQANANNLTYGTFPATPT